MKHIKYLGVGLIVFISVSVIICSFYGILYLIIEYSLARMVLGGIILTGLAYLIGYNVYNEHIKSKP